MVNLVKARQKAKKGGGPPAPPPKGGTSPQAAKGSAAERLERFKEEAGQKRMVAPATIEQSHPDDLELLTFEIDRERYAIEVERVMEVATPRPLTTVPNADPFILGVMSLRGVVVTMTDVRQRLRHPRNGIGQQVIVVTAPGGPIGFDVDHVLRPVKIGRDAIEPHPVVHASEERSSIRGVFRHANALTILLDLEKLLS